MNKQQVLEFWLGFFKGLLVDTFKNLFLFGVSGFSLGLLASYIFDIQVLDLAEWNNWLEIMILIVVGSCYLCLGMLHSWIGKKPSYFRVSTD